MSQKEIETFCPASQKDWRKWLEKNHRSTPSVWLVCYKKQSGMPVIPWSDLVEEALCFGWIDSKRKTIDANSFQQFFCKRKPHGTWSKVNKEKIEQLIAEKRMTQAGLDCIEAAKQNGSWTILDLVETLEIPKDLAKAFSKQPGSKKYFLSLSKSARKAILQWVAFAKRPETRQKRIEETAALAAQRKKPKQF